MRQRKTTAKPKTTRKCDFPGCEEAGEYRAPKDRNLREYYYFCLKHVTQYNKNWDFLKGLSADEIEEHLQNDTTWQRPTWKLGHGGYKHNPNVHDPLHTREDIGLGMDGKYNPPPPKVKYEKKMLAAMTFMELSEPITLTAVKKKYKLLAKKYHPDMNRGNKESEKNFQKLNEAYHYIIDHLTKS